MSKIKWCIIGAGGIADRRAIPALLLDEENEIIALMDKVPEVAKAVAEKYSVKRYYSDIDSMLSENKCDAVYIGTPVFCHKEQALKALSYGANVFMEKPITMNAEEGEELIRAFRKEKKLLAIGYMMGYHNLHATARTLIKNGKLGDIVSARFQFSCWYPDIPGAWRQNKAMGGGGCIMDLAVHCMELFHSVTGDDIVDYHAYFGTQTFSYEVEDSAMISFRSKNGVLGHIDVNFNIPDSASTSRMEIYGTKGSLFAEGTLGQEEVGRLKFIYSPQGDYEASQTRGVTKSKNYYGKKGNIYLKQFARFTSLIRRGKLDYSSAKEALKIQRICDEIYAQEKH